MSAVESIRRFYSSKVILVTGGTGLLGIILVHKLLKSCPDLDRIYVIARCKHGETFEKRKASFFRERAFRDTDAKLLDKIIFIEGQLDRMNIGIGKESMQTLKENVEIVLHCGSNVNWQVRLDKAVNPNLRGTMELLNIFKGSKKLKSFVYVSTIYSNMNGHSKLIEEKIYTGGCNPEEIVYLANTNPTDSFKEKMVIGDFVNSYVYSKNATERVLEDYKNYWPIAVFRASSLIAAYAEPYPYCLPKRIGLMRILDETARGVKFPFTTDVNSNMTPVDMTANALIALAYNIAKQTSNKIKVFNYTNFSHQLSYPMTMKYYMNKISDQSAKISAAEADAQEMFKTAVMKFNCEYNCLTGNVDQLWASLAEEEKALLPFDLKVIDWKDFLENMHVEVKRSNMLY